MGPRLSKMDINDLTAMDSIKFGNNRKGGARTGNGGGNYDAEDLNLMDPTEIRVNIVNLEKKKILMFINLFRVNLSDYTLNCMYTERNH